MKPTGSNHKTAAAWNRALTIRLLREHGSLSRQQISQITQLRGPTLSYIVRELLEKNLVRVVGKRQSRQVGQKQVLLTLNPEAGWVLGVSLRLAQAKLVLLDAAGGRIDGTTITIEGSLESVPAQLHKALQGWLHQRGIPAGPMLAIGMGVPGVVDADAGVLLRSALLNAVNVPLQRLLIEQFNNRPHESPKPNSLPAGGLTIILDHDACFGASAEAAGGAAAGSSHFLYFAINHSKAGSRVRINSFGSALYLEGRIYRGAFYAAGELASPLEPLTLETDETQLAHLANPQGELTPTLAKFAEHIGQSLALIVNLIDVPMIVLAGEAQVANTRFVAAVQQQVSTELVQVPDRSVRVVASQFEPEGVARGAAVAAFDAAVASGRLLGNDNAHRLRNGATAALTTPQAEPDIYLPA